jgi:hypothetical protein
VGFRAAPDHGNDADVPRSDPIPMVSLPELLEPSERPCAGSGDAVPGTTGQKARIRIVARPTGGGNPSWRLTRMRPVQDREGVRSPSGWNRRTKWARSLSSTPR